MTEPQPVRFSAIIEIIGVNPYVLIPPADLEAIFEQAGKSKGTIQVKGHLNGEPFIQTLVKFAGHWRLYLNMPMRKSTNTMVGDPIHVSMEFDPVPRFPDFHPKLTAALDSNPEAKAVFDQLPPSRQKEIVRYIAHLKSEESVDRNIPKAIDFLLGKIRFVGRDHP
ncbi:MAG TPA: YdeI/OmpD-associated family protein [Catalimonadaceae bacterium]|nr:YdeI/OmpD-associated family protein [Catalimonadaceae bacterium]